MNELMFFAESASPLAFLSWKGTGICETLDGLYSEIANAWDMNGLFVSQISATQIAIDSNRTIHFWV